MRKALVPAFLLILGAMVLGATVLREPIARAASPFTNVIIGNTSSNPVPVREQNLDGAGNIKVHEQGTASVHVTNSASAPLPVTNVNDGQNPYQSVDTEALETAEASVCASFASLPSGKRLVAQTFSGALKVLTGTTVEYATFGQGGSAEPIFVAPTKVGSDGTNDYYAFTQQIRAYVDDPEAPNYCVWFSALTGAGTLQVGLTGYLLNQ